MRPIDADEAYKVLTGYYHQRTEIQHKALKEAIERTPTIEAEPIRHGHWEMKADPYAFFDTIPVCSVCGCTTKYRVTSKFCPNCGAKMDEEVNENETY